MDGQTPVDLDEIDLIGIDPLPSWVWYQDMADFAEAIADERAGPRLTRPTVRLSGSACGRDGGNCAVPGVTRLP